MENDSVATYSGLGTADGDQYIVSRSQTLSPQGAYRLEIIARPFRRRALIDRDYNL